MSKDDETPPPSPEEITRKLADFMKANFGDAVSFSTMPAPFGDDDGTDLRGYQDDGDGEAPDVGAPLNDADIFDFDYHPRDIKAHLDRFVIRQDEAKKVLSIAVCDHYNHAKYLRRLAQENESAARSLEFAKQNVIIVGPTGVGKTYLVKHIAELIGVPFVKADATKFSETGYVGADVDDLVRELVRKADGDVELAEYGIIYIDEVDKIATSGSMIGRDVSGRGVQTTLLKLMEETEVPLRNPSDIQSQMQAMFDMQRGGGGTPRDSVNTRHILFIVSGAFSGLEKIISQRMRTGSIGFAAENRDLPSMDEEMFRHVETQDYLEFGFEAEFIGRLPVRVVCEHLTADDLMEIMLSSEGSLIRQYEREFEAFGIRVTFEDEALRKIAEKAAEEKTGARGLMTVCERMLRDFKFELPGTAVSELVIDGATIDDPATALEKYREQGSTITDSRTVSELSSFRRRFAEHHDVKISFENAAVARLEELSRERSMSVMQLCEQLFSDYQFGLKLIEKNSGQDRFVLPVEAVENPDFYLSGLVVNSYRDNEEARKMESAPVDGVPDDSKASDAPSSDTDGDGGDAS